MKDSYSSDKALENKDDDLFGRSSYASRIASVILSYKTDDSYVVGLYSPWGYGKTSTLHMIETELEESSKAIVIRFNPWSFDDEKAIVRGLLTDISLSINNELSTIDQPNKPNLVQRAKSKITQGGTLSAKESVVDLMSRYGGYAGVLDDKLDAGIQTTAKILGGATNDKIKKRIEDKIQESGKRIVIMIDDVDRLDKDEIFRLFKLIKVIADFKGVTYIVAFDDKAVAQALSERFAQSEDDGNAGQEFIEKIIQIPLHLPLIERETLDDLLLEGIQGVMDANGIEISQEEVDRFRGIFDEHIAPRIRTPRMVKRYLNSLNFTVPLVVNEVNITDFLILEGVRLLHSDMYLKLRDNKPLLTGTSFHIWLDSDTDNKKRQELTEKMVGDNEHVKEIVKELFPAIKEAYDEHNSRYPRNELTNEKRVASPDYFSRYFMYDLSPHDVSDSTMIEILSKDSASEIAKELEKLFDNRGKRQKIVLRKLKTYYKGTRNPIELARALMQIFDKVSDTKVSMFDSTPMDLFVDLIRDVLNESSNRLEGYETIVNECNDNDLLTYIIREVVLGSESDKREAILSPEELEHFKSTALTKIKLQSKKGILHKIGGVSHILYNYWAEFGTRDETNVYLLKKLNSLDKILAFLTPHLGVWTGGRGSHRGNFTNATYKYVSQVVDLDVLYGLATKKDSTLLEVKEYPDLEHGEPEGVGKLGNEDSTEFKEILAKQFAYTHQRIQNESSENTTEQNETE